MNSALGANGRAYEFEHNGHGRVKKIRVPKDTSTYLDTTITWDTNKSRPTKYTYPQSNGQGGFHETCLTWDRLYRLTKIEYRCDDSNPSNWLTVTFTYDKNDNITAMNDGRQNPTAYTFDDNNRLTRIDEPDTRFTTYTYDASGNLRQLRNADGNTVTYYSDNHGRLLQVWDPYGSASIFPRYDNGDRLVKVEYPGVSGHLKAARRGQVKTGQ
jgi:YD repeat-containing protein